MIGSCFTALRRQQIREDEAITLDDLARTHGNGVRKHRAFVREGVELATLAAGVDGCWQIIEKIVVVGAADKTRGDLLRVHARQMRPSSRQRP